MTRLTPREVRDLLDVLGKMYPLPPVLNSIRAKLLRQNALTARTNRLTECESMLIELSHLLERRLIRLDVMNKDESLTIDRAELSGEIKALLEVNALLNNNLTVMKQAGI